MNAFADIALFVLLMFGVVAMLEHWDQIVQTFLILLLTMGAAHLLAWIFLEAWRIDTSWKALVLARKLILYPLAAVFVFLGWDSLRYGSAYFLADARFFTVGDAAPSPIWALINMAIGALLFFLGACLWVLGTEGTAGLKTVKRLCT